MILRPAVSSTILVVAVAASMALLLSSQAVGFVKAAAEGEGCLSDPEALWCDEFDIAGKPNPKYWDYDLGDGGGWGNIEMQTYVEENAVVGADGLLHIQVNKVDPPVNYTSSRIKTENKVSFLYVRLEASIKVPDLTGGLWPAFWLLGVNFADIGWPMCGEIDIAEWGSLNATVENRLPFTTSSAVHWEDDDSDEDGGHKFETEYIVVDDNLNQDFHTYAMDWTPTGISFYLDDIEIFTKNIIGFEEFHKPFFLLLNVAVGGHYTGIYTPTSPGGEMQVDWIRAYPLGPESSVVVEPLKSSSAAAAGGSFSTLLSSISKIGILGLGLWTTIGLM